MTTPNAPLRFELTIEVPGTPEQVWDAIATANGISSWMMQTELDERVGGRVVFHMGPEISSEGSITEWDPPHRVAFDEPEWAALAEQDPATTTPLVTEFLVEATSGGTCVVRVVSSAFGSGADWEQEFFAEMGNGWGQMFEQLRVYLTHFPGQRVTPFEAAASDIPGTPTTVITAIRDALHIDAVGQTVDIRGSKAQVERIGDDALLLRLTDPVPGMFAFQAWGAGEGRAGVRAAGYLFSDDAAAYAAQEGPAWQAWMEGVTASR